MANEKVYLAGPDVFLPDAAAVGEAKKRICAAYGFVGLFPLDKDLDLTGLSRWDAALKISAANEALMRSCDLIVAHMTPFRGPGMDGGTAFEMGFMRALGRPVFGYSNDGRVFAERTRTFLGLAKKAGAESKKGHAGSTYWYCKAMLARTDTDLKAAERGKVSRECFEKAIGLGLEDYKTYLMMAQAARSRPNSLTSSNAASVSLILL